MKRTQLNRRAQLSRGKPLARMSKKRRKLLPARRACIEAVRKRCGGWCEARVAGICEGRMVTVHEPKKRSRGGDPTDPNQGIGICAACHRFTEDEPEEATRLGLMVAVNKTVM